jgi:hypothetical protein
VRAFLPELEELTDVALATLEEVEVVR